MPNVVLFPGATLPLHVFEPRYRALVRDALAGDRMFAVALLKPGFEARREPNPEICPIGCAGRITQVAPLPDGRYILNLVGTTRVEFLEMTDASPYRKHRVRTLGELLPHPDSEEARETLIRLVSAYQQILAALSGRSVPSPIATDVPFAETVNAIAVSLDIEPALKYRLLENGDLLARAERVLAILEAALPGYLGVGGDSIH